MSERSLVKLSDVFVVDLVSTREGPLDQVQGVRIMSKTQ